MGRTSPGMSAGQVLQVGGIEDEHVAAGHVAGGAERVGDAALAAMGDDPEEGVLPLQLPQHLAAIRRGSRR